MPVGLRTVSTAAVVVLTQACCIGTLHASPMANPAAALTSDAVAASTLDFGARATLPTPLPGWSLSADLNAFDTTAVLNALPPAKATDQAMAEAKSAAPPEGADTLPEPASILVLAIGLAGLYSLRRPMRPEAASRFSTPAAPRTEHSRAAP